MKRCECVNPYKKLYEEENIEVGDIISLDPIANRVKLSFNRINKKDEQIIGICEKIENNMIYVANTGIIDVNVEGIICIGDKLTISNSNGSVGTLNVISITSSKYQINDTDNYIYTKVDNTINSINQNLNVVNGTLELNNDILSIKYNVLFKSLTIPSFTFSFVK